MRRTRYLLCLPAIRYLADEYSAKPDNNFLFCNEKSLGDWSDGGTPGHIPNPEVKAISADGTWGAAPWESRSLPRDFFLTF